MASTAQENDPGQRLSRMSLPTACEACRKQKMRCTRQLEGADDPSQPCDRCRRNNRECRIPQKQPLGRRPGALGRYRGVEKAVRQIQTHIRKAARRSSERGSITPSQPADFDVLSHLPGMSPGLPQRRQDRGSTLPPDISSLPASAFANPRRNSSAECPHRTDDSVSNPLGLMANASGEAQANEEDDMDSASTTMALQSGPPPDMPLPPWTETIPQITGVSHAQSLLCRPGYVSLGLKLDRSILEHALMDLSTRPGHLGQYANYFKSQNQSRALDTGPDLDPIDLGLVSMEEACSLFASFFERLHPINGVLDPALHTPEFVRRRSALLFTWILAITAQFDPTASSLSKRLRIHGEKLSKHVHACGYKSVEIAQGYYLSLLCTVPASTMSEDHSWPYTTYATGMISNLALNPDQRNHQTASGPNQGEFPNCSAAQHETRLVRNRERTWFRLMLWERAHNAARGCITPFPENDLTQHVESWWQHPLSDPTDRYTCAFVLLRRHLAHLHHEVKIRLGKPNNLRHWVRDLVDSQLEPWRATWVAPCAPTVGPVAEQMRNVFLRYVYMHGRLWTLSFALYDGLNTPDDAEATTEDCFEATVNCCETTIRDLREIGEPMYCMMTPTWAMSSYAAVLALKLFPRLYGTRPGQEVELLALLSELALQLERAGTTPGHRFGIAALLGQHLLHILRRKLRALGGASPAKPLAAEAAGAPFIGLDGTGQLPVSDGDLGHADFCYDPMNPLQFAGQSPGEEDAAHQVFSGMMREWCVPWFESPV